MQDPNRFVTVTFPGDPRRWWKLFCICAIQFCIGFQYLNFGSIQSISAYLFDVDIDAINWLYSTMMLANLPVLFAAGYLFIRFPVFTHLLGVVCFVVAASMRLSSAWYANFPLAIASCVIMGASSGVWLTTLLPLVSSLFPQRKQAFAVSLGVQAAYLGFFAGGLVTPYVVYSVGLLRRMLLVQAVVVLMASTLFFVVFWRHRQRSICRSDRPISSGSRANEMTPAKDNRSLKVEMMNLACDVHFWVQLFAFGVLGGVRYAVSAIQDGMFARFGFASTETAWTQAANVCAGVVCGIAMGAYVKGHMRRVHLAIATCFVAASLSLAGLAYVLHLEDITFLDDAVARMMFFAFLIVMMTLLGGAGWGFQGLALYTLAKCANLRDSYAVASLLFLQNIVAVLLTSGLPCDRSMALAACLTWVSTVALIALYCWKPKTDTHYVMGEDEVCSRRDSSLTESDVKELVSL